MTTEPAQCLDEKAGGVAAETPAHIKDRPLEGLTPAQKQMALKLLTEEADPLLKMIMMLDVSLTLNLI